MRYVSYLLLIPGNNVALPILSDHRNLSYNSTNGYLSYEDSLT